MRFWWDMTGEISARYEIP